MTNDHVAINPVAPYLSDPDFTLYNGDSLAVLRTLPSESVDCCICSPPYWGLRDYGTGQWEGGDGGCDHTKSKLNENWGAGFSDVKNAEDREPMGQKCSKCGATRIDSQLGLEPTPEEYVTRMVEVFREVRRVLAAHGTCWVNMGDSYAGAWTGNSMRPEGGEQRPGGPGFQPLDSRVHARGGNVPPGLKPKDLCGIPWRLAFALQQPYYTGRIADVGDRRWLAAMIDGEGTICGFRHERPNGNIRTGVLTFITNSDERILDECDRIWPGARYKEKLKPGDRVLGGVATRTCWRWELQSAEDRSALVRELYPYLIAKRTQALVAWNMLELVQAAKRMGRGGETTEIKDKRDYLARTLSDLNQRRPVDLPSWVKEPPSLHEQGWYLRSDVIWGKNNPMPESVTDRPTKAHEYVFLLSKAPRYFFDQEAVREAAKYGRKGWADAAGTLRRAGGDPERSQNGDATWKGCDPSAGRNIRSVWEIATQPYPEAHFATFPEELVRRCLLAGCPEQVCGECGGPRERIVSETPEYAAWKQRESGWAKRSGDLEQGRGTAGSGTNSATAPPKSVTVGFTDCGHNAYRPGIVLDPFLGSGTTALVARKHGRRCVGIELSGEYCELVAKRTQQLSLMADVA